MRLAHASTALLLCLTLPAQAAIRWEGEFGAAMERAKAENRVVVACLNMDGERANDMIVAEHYVDPRIVELSKQTVNLFCSADDHGKRCTRCTGVTCAQHQAIDKRVRIDVLKTDAGQWIVAPQHVFIGPDGGVLSTVPYYVTPGELEWMWVTAIRKVRPDFAWEFGERARAPARMTGKLEVQKAELKPPSPAEVEAMLKEIKRGFGGYYGAREKLPILVRHTGSKAREFVERLMESNEVGDVERADILAVIGDNAPPAWAGDVAKYLRHENGGVRRAAAEALGKLADPKSIPKLSPVFAKDAEVRVRAAALRAMATLGPADARVLDAVASGIGAADEDLRVHAVLASALLEDRAAVHQALQRALGDAAPRVRATAAWAIATRREDALGEALGAQLEKETDPTAKKWLTAARDVLGGGDAAAFDKFLDEVVGKR